MENCLFTKLKAVVNNDYLLKLNEYKLMIDTPQGATLTKTYTKIRVSNTADAVNISCVGGATFTPRPADKTFSRDGDFGGTGMVKLGIDNKNLVEIICNVIDFSNFKQEDLDRLFKYCISPNAITAKISFADVSIDLIPSTLTSAELTAQGDISLCPSFTAPINVYFGSNCYGDLSDLVAKLPATWSNLRVHGKSVVGEITDIAPITGVRALRLNGSLIQGDIKDLLDALVTAGRNNNGLDLNMGENPDECHITFDGNRKVKYANFEFTNEGYVVNSIIYFD